MNITRYDPDPTTGHMPTLASLIFSSLEGLKAGDLIALSVLSLFDAPLVFSYPYEPHTPIDPNLKLIWQYTKREVAEGQYWTAHFYLFTVLADGDYAFYAHSPPVYYPGWDRPVYEPFGFSLTIWRADEPVVWLPREAVFYDHVPQDSPRTFQTAPGLFLLITGRETRVSNLDPQYVEVHGDIIEIAREWNDIYPPGAYEYGFSALEHGGGYIGGFQEMTASAGEIEATSRFWGHVDFIGLSIGAYPQRQIRSDFVMI